jgi:hypothetical protein
LYETGIRLRVCENRVLRRICGPKRDEVTGGRENHMRSLINFTKYSAIKSRRMRWAGYVAVLGERSAYRDFVGKPEETTCVIVHKITVLAAMNLQVPENAGNFLTS